MNLGNPKEIDGEEFYELLDHNGHVIGYVKDEQTYNNLILDSEGYKSVDKERRQAEDKIGDLEYKITHPRKK